MNIHEYQAKSILKQFGVAVPEGVVIENAEKAIDAAKQVGWPDDDDRGP